ncbi:MAG: hypothetical protein IKJ35_02685 [Clostridia bacterium]|nr:hypothetical protein [Clostridia bacterium]
MKFSGIEKHCFVCVDTSRCKIFWIDEAGEVVREIRGAVGCFDLFVLPDGRLLYAHFGEGAPSDGFSILNSDGSSAMCYRTEKEIFSCQPLPNGNILLGELGSRRIVEVSPAGEVVLEIPVPYEGNPHECFRAVRKIGEVYYAVQPGLNLIRKFTADGTVEREYAIRPDAFGLVMRPNGNLVYTCMSGAYELDSNGNEVWSLTDADVPEMGIRWLLGVQLLSNGNLVFTNWMGHGHTDEGIHFFEVNREKQVVWSCDARGTLREPAVLQILDEDAATVCYRPMK